MRLLKSKSLSKIIYYNRLFQKLNETIKSTNIKFYTSTRNIQNRIGNRIEQKNRIEQVNRGYLYYHRGHTGQKYAQLQYWTACFIIKQYFIKFRKMKE